MINKYPVWIAASVLMLGTLHAQSPAGPDEAFGKEGEKNERSAGDRSAPSRFWQATLPGGHYMVQLDRISSVSRHSYLLDGSVVVDEVTIDALGQAIVRFYQLRPLSDLADGTATGNAASRIIDRGRDLVENTASKFGSKATDMVIKKYPETTHARSIEYRLETPAQLSKLYASVRAAWESGRGRNFSVE